MNEVTEEVEYPAEVEIGEAVELVLDGHRITAFLTDRVFILDPHSHHCRIALRAFAYSLAAAGDTVSAASILREVGREG